MKGVLAPYAPARQASVQGLVWTEYIYLIAASFAGLVAVGELFAGLHLQNSVIKHMPFLIGGPAAVLHFTGLYIFSSQRSKPAQGVMSVLWPLITLAAYVAIGSLWARFQFHTRESFLILGIYLLFCPVAAGIMASSEAPEKLLRLYFWILVPIGLAVIAATFKDYRGLSARMHEREFLAIPLAVFCVTMFRSKVLRWSGALVFLASAVVARKNTAFLVAAATCAYIAVFVLMPRMSKKDLMARLTSAYAVFVVFTLILGAGTYVITHKEKFIPKANLTYRTVQYKAAWKEYAESPVWGTGFTGGSGQEFKLWKDPMFGSNALPTHNDILDIARSGGTIALLLWGYGLWRVGRLVLPKLLEDGIDERLMPYAHTLAAMSIGAVLVYAFNPILLKSGFSFLLWTNLGFLVGLALRSKPMRGPDSGSVS